MSWQADAKTEEKREARNKLLYRVLDYGLPGALEAQGIELLGFAVKYDAFNSLITIKAIVGGKRQVAFVGSDTVANSILKAYRNAQHDQLKWRPDKYNNDSD